MVGHALKNDFKALQIKHPKQSTRDTASYAPLTKNAAINLMEYVHFLLSLSPFPFALRSEKTRRLSKDATK